MGEVVDFTARRLEKQNAKAKITMPTIVADATDFLLGEWEKMARHNRLNDYFKRSLPLLIEHGSKINFMSDITEVAKLELNLDLFPIMYSPGTKVSKQMGWIVSFKLGEHVIETPELASEAYARCFGLLLFLKTKRDALAAGFLDEGPERA